MNAIWKKISSLSPFTIVTIVSFIVYLFTCSRHLTWLHDGADGGDLATCVWTLGIPHPTGYPLYCLIGYVFTHILPIGEVAFRLSIFSAVFAALGAGYIALSMIEASVFLFPDLPDNIRKRFIPLITGFSVAFSFSYWTQALIVEIYSLNAFFVALIIYMITRFINAESREEKNKLFMQSALIAGLGFTNHLANIYPFLAAITTVLYLGYIPSWKCFLKALGLFVLPLLLYFYLPLRSSMNPLMDWGNPENLEQFIWVLTGTQFKRLIFNSLFSQIIYRVFTQINLASQVGALGVVTSFLGIAYMLSIRGRKRLAFFILITSVVVWNMIHIGNYLVIDPLSFMLPAFMVIAIFIGIGSGFLIQRAVYLLKSDVPNSKFSGQFAFRSAKTFALLVTIAIFIINYGHTDVSGDSSGYDYAKRSFENAIPGSVICENYYGRGLTLEYYHIVEGWGKNKGIRPLYIEHLQYPWGKKNFHERYPDLELTLDEWIANNDEIAYNFIENNYDRLPAIYFGRMFDPPDGYEWEYKYDLYRIVRIQDQI